MLRTLRTNSGGVRDYRKKGGSSGWGLDGMEKLRREAEAKKLKAAAASPTGATAAATGGSGTPESVTKPFQQALDTLSGAGSDVEKMYQTGKRRTMSNIAMQSVNAGMANTLNMPAAELAYENEVRPGTNVGIAQAKAGVLQNLGQTAAGIYGTQVGASTARHGIDVGSQTSLQTAQMGANTAVHGQALQFASNQANQSLQRYIAELSNRPQIGGSTNTQPVPIMGTPRA